MSLKVITPPTEEQISLTQAREHLRIFDDGDSPAEYPDDAWLSGVGIPAAREYCEQWLGRALAPQTLEFALDTFPTLARYRGAAFTKPSSAWIDLPMGPVQSLTSVKYLDGDGAEQTVPGADYTFDDYRDPARIVTIAGWPSAQSITNAVKVRYIAGYDLPGDSPSYPLPFAIRAAMLLVLGHLFERRENTTALTVTEIPYGAECLMRPYQLRVPIA